MKPDTPIPPLTDGPADSLSVLLARLKEDLAWSKAHPQRPVDVRVTIADLTTVLHHLEAYLDAVEAWAHPGMRQDTVANLSAVHARAKGQK